MNIKLKRYSTLNWTHILIHHSATVDGVTYSWDDIDKYHKEEKIWDEIGYHFGIELVGDEYMYLLGRSLAKNGAHCPPMNWKAIGVCLVGNYDIVSPNNTQYVMLADLCSLFMREFDIPIENIQGHNKYANKTCPGELFDFDILKYYINGLPVGGIDVPL